MHVFNVFRDGPKSNATKKYDFRLACGKFSLPSKTTHLVLHAHDKLDLHRTEEVNGVLDPVERLLILE